MITTRHDDAVVLDDGVDVFWLLMTIPGVIGFVLMPWRPRDARANIASGLLILATGLMWGALWILANSEFPRFRYPANVLMVPIAIFIGLAFVRLGWKRLDGPSLQASQGSEQPTDGRRSDSFARLTEGAKNVLTLSQDESQRRNHAYIGTEHILVGIVREGGSAAKVLKAADIDLAGVREASAALVAAGSKPVGGEIALTASARRVLDSAIRATSEPRRPIGPEHLLLSLLSEGGAAAILNQLRVDPDAVRAEVLRSLGDDPDDGDDFTGSPVPRNPYDGSGSAAATATPEDEASQ